MNLAIANDGQTLRLTWPDGANHDVAARWLFDHAEGARNLSGQRGHGALALEAVKLEVAEVEGDAIRLHFSPGAGERRIATERLRGEPPPHPISLWPTPDLIGDPPPVPFQRYLGDDDALRETLARVARFGLAVLVDAGQGPDAVERAVERFGFIRETNYGRLFDVRIEAQPGNLAYTDRALDLHTDNPYRDPVPTLQLLHAITVDAGGGETLFVDAFAHAEALRREEPDAFDLLASTPVRFSFCGETGDRWSHVAPILSVDANGALAAVRVNHRSLDLAAGDAAATDAWYDAYLAFYRRLHAPEAAYGRRLAPGEMAIFDNRRLAHGRRALTSGSPRWLRGCYADVDGLHATLARLDRYPAPEAADAG